MTAVVSRVGSLQQIQWGVNELASGLYVGKVVGSLLTRKRDADVFRVLESQYGVKVRSLPSWLEGVGLKRPFVAFGESLRRIEGDVTMEELDVRALQGLATFVVLCCRYVDSDKAIVKRLEALLVGSLGAIDRGRLSSEGVPYALKPMLATFVRATKDADAASTQAAFAKEWMAQLLHQTAAPWTRQARQGRSAVDVRKAQVVGDLLGGPTIQEEVTKHLPSFRPVATESIESQLIQSHRSSKRTHETVSIDSAYIALAARANGADACVSCMTSTGEKTIPLGVNASDTDFVVRLWLSQPPEHISKILRYGDSSDQTTNTNYPSDASHPPPTVFGGRLELALAVAKQLSYAAQVTQHMSQNTILDLWENGFNLGSSVSWAIKPMLNRLYPLRFHFPVKEERVLPSIHALALVIEQHHKKLAPLARHIATIVDKQYQWSEYTEVVYYGELIAAADLVTIAIAVGSLHKLTHALGGNLDQYALNLSAIEEAGALSVFCAKAVTEGVSTPDIIWAACLLWGGASIASQGNERVTDSVLGVVAPHATILLDIVRNPLQFVKTGMQGKLLLICHGSMPVVSRDPGTGYIKDNHHGPNDILTLSSAPTHTVERIDPDSSLGKPRGDLIITFEPDVLGNLPFRSIFCCWYQGHLAFEVGPMTVFTNILKRGAEGGGTMADSQRVRVDSGSAKVRPVGWLELLSVKHFRVDGANQVAVVNAYDLPGWLVAITGVAPPGVCVFQRLAEVDWEANFIEPEDTVILSEL